MTETQKKSIIEKYGSIENYKKELSKKLSGKHFYTNGVEDRKFSDDEKIPEGWVRGRTNSGKGTKGYFFINNGVEQTQVPKGSKIPEGWKKGALSFTEGHKEKISKALKNYERTEEHNKALKAAHNTEEYFENYKKGCLYKYGVENVFASEEIKEKIRQTNLEKYGVEYASQSEEVKQKKIETTLSNLGVEHPMQSKEVQEKSKQTSLKNWGTEYPHQSNEIKGRVRKTCQEKYGADSYLGSDVGRQRIEEICLNRYGTKYPSQSEEVKRKTEISNLNARGVKYPLESREVLKKQIETNLKRHGVMYNIQLPQSRVGSNDSEPNRRFASKLEESNIEFEREFPVKRYKFDFKVGNILIEIDPYATHNTLWNPFGNNNGLDKNYHQKKSQTAEAEGYQVIHIFDWDDQEKIIKNLLLPKEKVYARKTKVFGIDKNEANNFLNEHHLQGTCNGQKVCLGLRDEYGELISLMTFGKPRYNKNYQWELLRYCSSKNVVGGARKLFKHFVNQYNPENIISYCDKSKFRGDVYVSLGFEVLGENRPSKHWYSPTEKRLPHITDNFLRQRGYDQLFNESYGKGTSNEELIIKRGYVSICDCGQSSYVWGGK